MGSQEIKIIAHIRSDFPTKFGLPRQLKYALMLYEDPYVLDPTGYINLI